MIRVLEHKASGAGDLTVPSVRLAGVAGITAGVSLSHAGMLAAVTNAQQMRYFPAMPCHTHQQQAAQDAQQGGLAATVGPQQHVEAGFWHMQACAVQHLCCRSAAAVRAACAVDTHPGMIVSGIVDG